MLLSAGEKDGRRKGGKEEEGDTNKWKDGRRGKGCMKGVIERKEAMETIR